MRYEQAGISKIPIVDLSAARAPDTPRLGALVEELRQLCLAPGFFYVENHGIPGGVVQATREQTLEFFGLRDSEKAEVHIAKSPYHRGYFPEGEENARGHPYPDVKEGFEMAVERPMDDPTVIAGKPFHGPNAWPASLPRFRPALSAMFDGMRAMCDDICGLVALAMGLPRDFFAGKTDDPLCQMRIVRYPPQGYVPVGTPQSVGSGPHTDYGIVSIIWQMDGPGLEIETPSGEWISCPVVPGTFICQLGDATQIWTNDVWKATRHRVVNATGKLRHALAYFHDPNYDCRIAPLEVFVTPERAARHAETTMGALVTSGFNGAYAYRDWSKAG